MYTNFFLKLNQFEGPLDLLLHLIRVHEIDILNIDILVLTDQYLKYLRLIKFQNLHQAGEFLDMAASLIEMKSRALLPSEENDRISKELGEDEEDTLESLQARLLEYEQFKRASAWLSSRPQLGVDIYSNNEFKRLSVEYEDVEAPLKGDPSSLVILYEHLLKTIPDRKAMRIEAETHRISIEEKITELENLLERVNFALFQGFYKKFKSRYEFVVYIMAVLEMVRWRRLKVYQADALGPLWIYKMGLEETELPLSPEERRKIIENAASIAKEELVVAAAEKVDLVKPTSLHASPVESEGEL